MPTPTEELDAIEKRQTSELFKDDHVQRKMDLRRALDLARTAIRDYERCEDENTAYESAVRAAERTEQKWRAHADALADAIKCLAVCVSPSAWKRVAGTLAAYDRDRALVQKETTAHCQTPGCNYLYRVADGVCTHCRQPQKETT